MGFDFDVAVVGAGPGGSSAAALLSRAGLKTWTGRSPPATRRAARRAARSARIREAVTGVAIDQTQVKKLLHPLFYLPVRVA